MALILGIDISKTSVRGALIRTSLRNVEVERYLACPVAAFGAEATGGHTQEAAAVRELMRMLGVRPDSVVSAVDGLRVSARTLRIPLATKKRAAEVLPFELESQLPFEVTSAIIDFQDVVDEDNEAELLVVAAPDHAIEQTLALLTEAGVDPKELAAGHAALDGLMVVEPNAPGDVLLLLNLDTASTDVCLVRNGRTELCRTLDEGLDDAAQNPGALLRALHQTLMKYRSEGGAIPTACRVMGVGAEVPALLASLSAGLSLDVVPVVLPPPKRDSEPASPVFGKALALAYRVTRRGKRIDLRKGKHALTRGAGGLRRHAILLGACGAALLASFGYRTWAELRVLESERDALAARLAELSETQLGERTENPRRARELLEGGNGSKDPLPRFDAFRALSAISAAFPTTTPHDTRKLEITLDDTGQVGKFEIQGQIPDLAARDSVAEALEAHTCIEQLERGKSSPVPGIDRKNYVLEGVIACAGVPKKSKSGDKSRAK
ncbi:MAG: hypothetical protein RL385_3485 [Pseudomonadota bacterium]|jgi:general secretion pathway protein L